MDTPNPLSTVTKVNPWKVPMSPCISLSSSYDSGDLSPKSSKSLRDIMYEEEEQQYVKKQLQQRQQQHEKNKQHKQHKQQQQRMLKKKERHGCRHRNNSLGYDCQNNEDNNAQKSYTFYQKQKQILLSPQQSRTSNGKKTHQNCHRRKKNQQKSKSSNDNDKNRLYSNQQAVQNRQYPENHGQNTNCSNHNRKSGTDGNNKKKKSYNSSYESTTFHRTQNNYDGLNCNRNYYTHHSLIVPSFTEISPSLQNQNYNHNINNEFRYTMMSCQEYYDEISRAEIKNIQQQQLTKKESKSIVALDCEMVGVGEHGERSALARVSIVNWDYEVLLDTYVKVDEPVTDYRTFVSGVRDEDITSDRAMDLRLCCNMVKLILRGKILVGHGLENDLTALCITHPKCDTRDTAYYPLYMTATLVSPMEKKRNHRRRTSSISTYTLTPSVIDSDCSSTGSTLSFSSTSQESHHSSSISEFARHGRPMMQLKPRKLKEIAREWLGIMIQKNGEEHSPLEDALAALALYKLARVHWEDQ